MTLQLTESHQGAAPVNWKHGDDVVVGAVLARCSAFLIESCCLFILLH